MNTKSSRRASGVRSVLSELPPKSEYDPVREAIIAAEQAQDKSASASLRLFASMPASTAVIANPVLYRTAVRCGSTDIRLKIRGFAIRGLLTEDDILGGKADALRVIFVGLFGRLPVSRREQGLFSALISRNFYQSVTAPPLDELARFIKKFPSAGPELAIEHFVSLRKAEETASGREFEGIRARREPGNLLKEMLRVHLSNAAVGACASYMRQRLTRTPGTDVQQLVAATMAFVVTARRQTRQPFRVCLSLMLGRVPTRAERTAIERIGTIQIHHGSAGSNMVARYMASLETASTWDLFSAGHMALNGRRHFGTIHDMSEFVGQIERLPGSKRRARIRERLVEGNLPTFGHPEIAAASRAVEIETDPRPALYLEPLFEAIDAGQMTVAETEQRRLRVALDMYRMAFVSGIVKTGDKNKRPLRVAPNTDFGAWCVQEALGIAEPDRTLLSYLYRGFGWMMDVREQLQQRIIRPVIPPDPGIVPEPTEDSEIPGIVAKVHRRLGTVQNSFHRAGSDGAFAEMVR